MECLILQNILTTHQQYNNDVILACLTTQNLEWSCMLQMFAGQTCVYGPWQKPQPWKSHFFPPLFHHRVTEWPCRSWNTKVTVARPVVGVGAPYCTQICDRCSGSLRWNLFKLPYSYLWFFLVKRIVDGGMKLRVNLLVLIQKRFKMIQSFQIRPLKLPSTHGRKHHFRKKNTVIHTTISSLMKYVF